MKSLDQIIEEAREASTTGLEGLDKHLAEDSSAVVKAGLLLLEESIQAHKGLAKLKLGPAPSASKRLLQEEVSRIGGPQAWVDLRAAQRGLSLGTSTSDGRRHVRVFISSLADGDVLKAVREMIVDNMHAIATARVDLPSMYPADLVENSEIVTNRPPSTIHCVVVPAAWGNYASR